jgi:gas vesicle protein
MTEEIAGTRENLSRDVDALYDKVSPGRVVERKKAAVRGRLSTVKDSVMGSAQSVGGSAQGAAGSVTGSVSGAASSAVGTVQDTAHSAVGTVQSQTQGSPIAAGLMAFGAGMVISALIPASKAEAQAAQQLTEAVKDSPIMDQAKSVGQEMGQHLKETAQEAAQEVKGTAQEAAQNVKDEGQSAAQNVKQEAPGT